MTSPDPAPNRYFDPESRKALEEEARRIGSRPRSAEELAADVFESDEELDMFLAALREWRRAG